MPANLTKGTQEARRAVQRLLLQRLEALSTMTVERNGSTLPADTCRAQVQGPGPHAHAQVGGAVARAHGLVFFPLELPNKMIK